MNYGERASLQRNLLDFIDKIGCRVLLNPELHSKLILSNDLALIGSFNLSKSALYEMEETGVSIDDMDNLRVLEKYTQGLILSSTPFGYTEIARQPLIDQSIELFKPATSKITRGWLYEGLLKTYYQYAFDSDCFYTFLTETIFENETVYLQDIIGEIGSGLGTFYAKAFFTCCRDLEESNEEGRHFRLKDLTNYQGKHRTEEIIDFLESRLAREHIPNIPLQMTPFGTDIDRSWIDNIGLDGTPMFLEKPENSVPSQTNPKKSRKTPIYHAKKAYLEEAEIDRA